MRTLALGIGAVAVVFGASQLLSEPWHLAQCSESSRAVAAQHAAKIRAANPGDALYLPHPFPRVDPEVAEDFAYQYLAMLEPRFPRLDQWDLELVSALRAHGVNAYRAEVVEVANWLGNRCPTEGYGASDAVWLLRLFDRRAETEIVRATLLENGQLLTYVFPEAGGTWPLPEHMRLASKAEVTAVFAALGRTDVEVRDAQYVAAYGTAISCGRESTCLAVRDRGRHFLFADGVLYELDVKGERFHSQDLIRRGRERDAMVSKLRPKQSFLGVGAGEMLVATRLN